MLVSRLDVDINHGLGRRMDGWTTAAAQARLVGAASKGAWVRKPQLRVASGLRATE